MYVQSLKITTILVHSQSHPGSEEKFSLSQNLMLSLQTKVVESVVESSDISAKRCKTQRVAMINILTRFWYNKLSIQLGCHLEMV